MTTIIHPLYLVAWLGNRSTGECVFIPGVNPLAITTARAPTPEKLALKLLSLLFTVQELADGNFTPPKKPGVVLLDQKKFMQFAVNDSTSIWACMCVELLISIHCIHLCPSPTHTSVHVKYKFPKEGEEEEKKLPIKVP